MNEMRKAYQIAFIALIVTSTAVLALAPTVRASNFGEPSGNGVELLNPLCTSGGGTCNNDVASLIQSIVKWLFVIATPIAVGMILIGAFQMLLSGGNEDKFATGKKTVLYAVIGYAIILIGWGITSIIQSLL